MEMAWSTFTTGGLIFKLRQNTVNSLHDVNDKRHENSVCNFYIQVQHTVPQGSRPLLLTSAQHQGNGCQSEADPSKESDDKLLKKQQQILFFF